MDDFLDYNTAAVQGADPNAWIARPNVVNHPIMENKAAFLAAVTAEIPGLETVETDGGIHRFPTTGDKSGQQSGWYAFFNDRWCAGVAGDWRTGKKVVWRSIAREAMTAEQARKDDEFHAEVRRRTEALRQKHREEAARTAKGIMDLAVPAPADHPYLVKKKISNYHVYTAENGAIVVPVHDFDGTVTSLQYIFPDGKKRFLKGGEISGRFHQLGTLENDSRTIIAICEGWATGQTIWQATGWPVFCTFSTSNMLAAAERIREAYPMNRIVVCADNDHKTEGNPGVTTAARVAKAIRAHMVAPKFSVRSMESSSSSDFNDLACLEGLQAVKHQLGESNTHRAVGFKICDIIAPREFCGPPPPVDWLVNGIFQRGQLGILAAMGDIGKGMLTLELALKVAGPTIENLMDPRNFAFGNPISARGRVVYLTAEDTREDVHRRLYGIDPTMAWEKNHRLHVVALPNHGGPFSLIQPGRNGAELSAAFLEIREELLGFDDLVLVVFDPLASFCAADINSDPAVGAFLTGKLAALAKDTNASILLTHHLNKGSFDKPIRSPEQARNAVRGSTAIVDGVRLLYCLWLAEVSRARAICQQLGVKYERNKVVFGAVGKANGPVDRAIRTYVRSPCGLLEVVDDALAAIEPDEQALIESLLAEITEAAEEGKPYTKTSKGEGGNGLYTMRHEFRDKALRDLSKHKLVAMADQLLEEGRVVLASATKGGTVRKYLVNADSKLAVGEGCIEPGARLRK